MRRSYLFIGGAQDGSIIPVAPDQNAVQLPANGIDREIYIRTKLAIGDTSIAIYRHESLTPEQVLDQIVMHYTAWAANRPVVRR